MKKKQSTVLSEIVSHLPIPAPLLSPVATAVHTCKIWTALFMHIYQWYLYCMQPQTSPPAGNSPKESTMKHKKICIYS